MYNPKFCDSEKPIIDNDLQVVSLDQTPISHGKFERRKLMYESINSKYNNKQVSLLLNNVMNDAIIPHINNECVGSNNGLWDTMKKDCFYISFSIIYGM